VSAELRDATVAIIGLGLMGGSLGRALDGHCARRIGADRDAATAARALQLGAVDEVAGDAEACASHADLLVLAMPVGQVIEDAPALAAQLPAGAVLTDLGSTKAAVCGTFDQLPGHVAAVGGHPMCGRAGGGIDAADGELFRGARWVVCPTARTTPDAQQLVEALARAVGADPIVLDPSIHDRAVATASHLPYVIAQALVGALADADAATDGAASTLASTGFAGATRLAAGGVDMWRDILLTNAPNVRTSLAELRARLDAIESVLDDPAALESLLGT
jgi:prephenate dehydrogenase